MNILEVLLFRYMGVIGEASRLRTLRSEAGNPAVALIFPPRPTFLYPERASTPMVHRSKLTIGLNLGIGIS